jgi:hypothetical protein
MSYERATREDLWSIGFAIVLVLALLALVASGCGWKNVTPEEKHRIVAKELGQLYIDAHHDFQRLEQELPASAQDELDELREPMNDAKDLIGDYLDLVIADHIEDAGAKEREVRRKINEIVGRIVRLGIKYGVTVESEKE